jgi:hypothetical protein
MLFSNYEQALAIVVANHLDDWSYRVVPCGRFYKIEVRDDEGYLVGFLGA